METLATRSLACRQLPKSAWFSPDGRKLIIALKSAGTMEVWDLAALGSSIRRLGLQWEQATVESRPNGVENRETESRRIKLHLAEGSMLDKAAKAAEKAAQESIAAR